MSVAEDGILDQIEMSSGRGVSFLKSQSSSFKFPDNDAPVIAPTTAEVGVGSGVVKSAASLQPSISRVASEVIPEGENEEESVGEGDGLVSYVFCVLSVYQYVLVILSLPMLVCLSLFCPYTV